MWTLYDKLIGQISDEYIANEVIAGLSWTAIQSKSLGLAMSMPRSLQPSPLSGNYQGQPIQKLANSIKSWDFFEASLGLSAINSATNTLESVLSMESEGYRQLGSKSALSLIADKVTGKRVAVIGHFPDLDKLASTCQLTILERRLQIGDTPDPAAEYLLPEQDIVIMTSSTLINKTAPRLLELSKDAVTIMLGPSTPLSPVLFEMGVDMISGLIVEDEENVLRCVKEGGGMRTFRNAVRYVNLAKADSLIGKWEMKSERV